MKRCQVVGHSKSGTSITISYTNNLTTVSVFNKNDLFYIKILYLTRSEFLYIIYIYIYNIYNINLATFVRNRFVFEGLCYNVIVRNRVISPQLCRYNHRYNRFNIWTLIATSKVIIGPDIGRSHKTI